MKILKLELFQESACYRKPFAFKVAETYPLPPYSTVIGMLHKVLKAQSGEYFPMNISVQGEYESIFNNYQTLRNYKENNEITKMPRNISQLYNVKIIIHVKAEDDIIDKIYNNIINNEETVTLGRNEDIVRIDSVKIIKDLILVTNKPINKYNVYVPNYMSNDMFGINYRLNTTYVIKNDLRKWSKVNVKYVEKHTNRNIKNVLQDEDGDLMYFYEE